MAGRNTTYWEYIKVEELLALQGGIEADEAELTNDEVLFIAVHQIDELWFKLVLRELVAVRDCFVQVPVPEMALATAVRGIRRTSLLLHNVAQHFALMETLTTRDYLAFRDKLFPASGFQSAQLREIEILLGLPTAERVHLGYENSYLDALKSPDGQVSPALTRVQRRLADLPSLRDALRAWLFRTPIQGSSPDDARDAERVRGFIEAYLAAQAREIGLQMASAGSQALTPEDVGRLEARYERERASARDFLLAADVPEDERARTSRIRAALVFIESYRELPLLAWPRELVDGIVELEQAFLIFRQRHARMVERVIGRRTGTGGSAGVEYLDQTALKYRVFSEVWAVRTLLLRRDALPPIEDAAFYDFVRGH
jgi:tryptophan 2,3-dioxygenase